LPRADAGSGLLDRHLAFIEALRGAGLSVSLAEDIDSVAALSAIGWGSRAMVRDAMAATLLKRQTHRTTFDALFDVYFPPMVGHGVSAGLAGSAGSEEEGEGARDASGEPITRDAAALQEFRERLAGALEAGEYDDTEMARLAAEMVGQFGAMPGRGPGMSSWSAYTALQRVAPQELIDRIIAGLLGEADAGDGERIDATRVANLRVGRFTAQVEADARRRIAEEKGPDHIAEVAIRPSIDKLAFMSARKADLEEMRREIFPLARRLATRLAKEQHSRQRGPLDFRRTVRASIATGGVPLTTHHKPKRPHRTDLVVLCDVSGSVANFAQFTLLFVFALREAFSSMRAFTFIDHVHEVTSHLRPGADPVDVIADLSASAAHAALWGRTNYGRAFGKFEESYADALTPKTTLLILGDARSNYADLNDAALRRLAGSVRRAYWLNPEHVRNWGTGDSAAPTYSEIVQMLECRNLEQLSDFVHDLV
jgi:uncharacterized protein with von Willebrand factor type A (vWA) domain